MSQRLVVYLDTNFLSDLAKVSLGGLKGAAARRAEEALAFFTSLVDSRVAIFPNSWSRQQEAELRSQAEFQRAARNIAARLSRGVCFRPHLTILSNQIERAFIAHLNGMDYLRTWQEALTSDPRRPIYTSAENDACQSWVQSDPQRLHHRRLLKSLFVKHHQQRAQQRPNLTLTYEDLKAANAREYAKMIVLDAARRFLRGEDLDSDHEIAATSIWGAISVAAERGDIRGTSFWDFADSAAIVKVPAIDIWASIEASMEWDEPSRGWHKSDHHDLEALSDVLPYCDAVFCDRNMKDILRKRTIASRYGAAVYSMRDFDQFRRDVEAGPAGPLKAMDPHVAPIVERWDRLTEHLASVVRSCDPGSWTKTSPYPGWTYKDLLAHLATGYTVRLAQLRGLVEKGDLGAEPDADTNNAENVARHRESSPEALVEEMIRQRSEVRRLMGLLRPEHLEARTPVHRRGQAPRDGSFLEALQHWHEHDLEHAADLSPIMRWPVAAPEL